MKNVMKLSQNIKFSYKVATKMYSCPFPVTEAAFFLSSLKEEASCQRLGTFNLNYFNFFFFAFLGINMIFNR